MKKLLIVLVLLLICGTAYADPGENIAVLFVTDQSFNQNAEMFEAIQKTAYEKFPKQRYDVKIYGKDSSSAISEFMERYNKDNKIATKANAVTYGKDVGATKLIVIRMIPIDSMQWYNGMGGNWVRCRVELEIKGFVMAEDKYIADKTITTQNKEHPKKGVEQVLAELKAWRIPAELQ